MRTTAARITGIGRRSATLVLALLVLLSGVLVLGEGVARAGEGYRRELWELTNSSRVRHDVRRLQLDIDLSKAARRHSRWMSNHGLRHSSSSDMSRYLRGRNWHRWGENIGYSYTDLEDLQDAFMGSRPHRHNILARDFERVGVGVVQRGRRLWATIIFYG